MDTTGGEAQDEAGSRAVARRVTRLGLVLVVFPAVLVYVLPLLEATREVYGGSRSDWFGFWLSGVALEWLTLVAVLATYPRVRPALRSVGFPIRPGRARSATALALVMGGTALAVLGAGGTQDFLERMPEGARMFIPPGRLDDVLGDLEEVHGRRRAERGAPRAWLATSAEALAVAGVFLRYRWHAREGGGGAWLTWPEVKLALRLARRQPVLNGTAVLALATGIGLSAAAYTLADALLFATLPLPGGERFVRMSAVAEEDGRNATPEADRFEVLAGGAGALEYLGAMTDGSVNLLDDAGNAEPLRGVYITPDAFRILPYRSLVGRTLLAADGEAGAPSVAVLRESLWVRRFGGDPAAVGRTLNLGGREREVVGVLPDDAGFPNEPDVWMPLTRTDVEVRLDAGRAGEGDGRSGPRVALFGVLRPGATPEGAAGQLQALSRAYERDRPGAVPMRIILVPYTQVPQSGFFQILMGGLLGVVVLVLVVIAANVGNLVSARAASRTGELAVRTALGASRRRLVVQLFVEVLVLGVIAAVVGWIGVRALMSWIGAVTDDLPFWVDFTPGAPTLGFVAAVTLVACVVAGVVPALRATRGGPAAALRVAGRGAGGGALGRGGAAMAVAQVAVSVGLLGTAVVAARGLAGYAGVRVDVPASEILTARLSPAGERSADSARLVLDAVEGRVRALPGVVHAGVATALPGLDPSAPATVVEPAPGEAEPEPRPAPVVEVRPGFLETLGASAVAGRLLEPADFLQGAPRVAVVNEPFVATFLGGRNAVGRRIRGVDPGAPDGSDPEWREIVGVVPDLGLSVGDRALAGGYYVPLEDAGPVYLAMRVSGDPATYAAPLRRAVAAVDPDLLLPRVETLDRAGAENARALRAIGAALAGLGGMALLLSLVSTYALVSLTVSRRVREIGVRVALGAPRGSVLRTVVGRATLHLMAGALLGVGLGAALVRLRGIFVFRVPSDEPWVLPLVALFMAGAGAAASWVPARRALRIRPADALRAE